MQLNIPYIFSRPIVSTCSSMFISVTCIRSQIMIPLSYSNFSVMFENRIESIILTQIYSNEFNFNLKLILQYSNGAQLIRERSYIT